MSELGRISDALQFIPASDRDTWLRMGMAVKSELGDTGFDVWNAWSATDDAYNARAARDVWKSIHANGAVTAKTLFHKALAHGWQDAGTYQNPTPEQEAERDRVRAETASRDKADLANKQAEAKAKATAIWNAAKLAKPDHPYLARKHVSPVTTLKEIRADVAATILGYSPKCEGEPLAGRLLVAPVKVGDAFPTVELIDESGRKSALYGGAKAGGYWAAQPLPEGGGLTLLIGEGVATVLSAREASGHPAFAALSDTNLPAVAKAIRELYPAANLVILADLVKATGAPDRHATEAALAVNGLLAIPDFGADRGDRKDFNDMAQQHGAGAVGRCIANAKAPDKQSDLPATRTVEFIRGSDVIPEAITWLWPGYLVAGKMNILGGAPGTGKTTISMALAATVTTGGLWPDGTKSPIGNVAIWSGEDDPADTLIPRLSLSGADLSRVFFVSDVVDCGERRSFDPARDTEPLRRKLVEVGDVRLLIVDPIVSAIAGDSHKNAETRRGLQPLADLAAAMRCAVLGITHFSKGTSGRDPVERLTGSLAFGALARVVLVAAKHQEEGEDGRTVRVFLRAKSNIGPDDGGFEYDLHQSAMETHPGIFASCVLWGEAVEGAARELLATADATGDDGEGGSLADAKHFLSDLLADGPLPNRAIRADADGAGYSWATIRRAQKALGIEAVKEGGRFGGPKPQWLWKLPETLKVLKNTEDAQQKEVGTFSKVEHLQSEAGISEAEI